VLIRQVKNGDAIIVDGPAVVVVYGAGGANVTVNCLLPDETTVVHSKSTELRQMLDQCSGDAACVAAQIKDKKRRRKCE